MIFASTASTASVHHRRGMYLAAGVGWGRMHTPNPILIDARNYYVGRRTMNNPGGWAHVLRKVESALAYYGNPDDLWDGATAQHVDHALKVLSRLAAIEQSGSERP